MVCRFEKFLKLYVVVLPTVGGTREDRKIRCKTILHFII